jgi:arabinofuranosyltransferase
VEDPSSQARTTSPLRRAAALLLAFSVCSLVLRDAWVSEDSFITFRYVSNALAGFGAVFNVGEYVQGYTHPLWFSLLVLGHSIVPDIIKLAIGLGVVISALTVFVVTQSLLRRGGDSLHGGLISALFALLCVSSDAWLSFQTSGLENPLSQLIIAWLAIEVFSHGFERLGRITLLGAFLVTTRPDFAFFFLPISLCLLPRLKSPKEARAIFLGATPLVAWLVFALGYYGGIVPNTAKAKVGIFPTWWDASSQGLWYLRDWIGHETFPALISLGLLVFATLRCRSLDRRAVPGRAAAVGAFTAGAWLHLFYVVGVGGDFMRGRFLLPIFVAGLVIGLLTLVEWLQERSAPNYWSAIFVLIAVAALPLAREPEAIDKYKLPKSGIVDERLYYTGYHLDSYLKRGELRNPYLKLSLADQLRGYAEACGDFTLHVRNPGTLGYLAGPRVSIIDALGLTDAYIAALPRESLIHERPRVGHPDKYVPLHYLAGRRDIAILEGWKQAVENRDCAFPDHTQKYLGSEELWAPRKLFKVVP